MKTKIALLLIIIPLATGGVAAKNPASAQSSGNGASSSNAVVNWPIEISGPDGTAVVYQPQPDSFKDDQITARTAVSLASQLPANKDRLGQGQISTRPAKSPNNVLADKSGNVYRKSGNDWQQRDKKGWSKPGGGQGSSDFTKNRPQLERDNFSRERGQKMQPQQGSQSGGSGKGGARGGRGDGGPGGGGRRR